jgi:dTDP-4-amino-4,6-dideoxygalactose transaminase
MLNTSLAPWPSYNLEELDAVADVLGSNRVNYWTGQQCREFERDFAAWSGAQKAIAVSNGTLALDLALQGLRVGAAYGGKPTDEVIVTPRTFIASISCVVNAGAIPVFADVDKDSGLMTAETIAAVLTDNARAIVAVHLAGWPCEMDSILQLAAERNLRVIEDCAQAHGALYKGRSVGSIGNVGAWSFCQDKIMTTGGEGGMVTCDDETLWSRMWSFKDHGKSWDAVYNREHAPGFRWLHESIGTNWRMLEMQAAIGRIQLQRMEAWTSRRKHIASRLTEVLGEFATGIRVPLPPADLRHAYYRLYAYVTLEGLKPGWSRDRIVQECSDAGAPVYQGSCSEVYLEKAFDGTGWRPASRLPVARELGETSLMFLTHPTITDEQLDGYCNKIREVIRRACC